MPTRAAKQAITAPLTDPSLRPMTRIRELLAMRLEADDPLVLQRRDELLQVARLVAADDAGPVLEILTGVRPPQHPRNVEFFDNFRHRVSGATRRAFLAELDRRVAERARMDAAPLTVHWRQSFEGEIRNAVQRLRQAHFSRRAVVTDPQYGEGYDARYWETVEAPAPIGLALAVRPQLRPSEAVAKVLDEPKRWYPDCAQWVQLVEICTRLLALGADEFDIRVPKPGRFMVGLFNSTGVWHRVGWQRKPHEPFNRFTQIGPSFTQIGPVQEPGEPDERSTEELLAAAPIGSRIAWTVQMTLPPVLGNFRNENAVKLGSDLYAAHPFGYALTRTELEQAYARQLSVGLSRTEAEVAGQIGVSVIQIYEVP